MFTWAIDQVCLLWSETDSQFGSENVAFGGILKENAAPGQISLQHFKGSVSGPLGFPLLRTSEKSQTWLNISLEHRVGATQSKDIHCSRAGTPEWS